MPAAVLDDPHVLHSAEEYREAVDLVRNLHDEAKSRPGRWTRSVPHYRWDVSCQGSVPEAIVAFLDSSDVEDAIRLAVSLSGDADTQAAIAGGIAEAFYKRIPATIVVRVLEPLPPRFVEVIDAFQRSFPLSSILE